MGKNTLKAQCGSQTPSVDLNKHIGDGNGYLKKGSGYTSDCKSCRFDEKTLKLSCACRYRKWYNKWLKVYKRDSISVAAYLPKPEYEPETQPQVGETDDETC